MKEYIVYKTTNLLNNHFYIGVHHTEDFWNDDYYGSSKKLKEDIAKFGKGNFKKEPLEVFDTEKEAYKREAEVVNKDLVKLYSCYNQRVGGKGASSGENHHLFGKKHKSSSIVLMSKNRKNKMTGKDHPLYGVGHTEETKQKMLLNNSARNEVIVDNKKYLSCRQACKELDIANTTFLRAYNNNNSKVYDRKGNEHFIKYIN